MRGVRGKVNLLYLSLIVFSIFVMLSFLSTSMMVCMILSVAFFLLFLSPQDGLILVSFASCFYKAFQYQSLYASVFLVYIFLLALKSVIFNYKKFEKKSKKIKIILILTFLYLFIQPLIFSIINKHIYYAIIKLYIFLISFIVVYFLWGEVDLKLFTQIFCLGIVTSCGIAILGFYTGLIEYSRLFMYDSAEVVRFSGIFMHPNSLARFCLLGVTLLFVLWRKDKKDLTNYFFMLSLALLGAMSYSKTYLIAFVAILIYFFCYYLYHSSHKKQFLLSSFVVLIALACVGLIKINYIKDLLHRFDSYYGGDAIQALTTGRYEIWKLFIEEQKSSVWYILFGESYMGFIPVRIGAHSTYLALFYQYGIVGCGVLITFLVCLFKSTITIRFRKIRLLPILLLLTTGLVGDQIFTHNGYLLWLIALTALMENTSCDYLEEITLTSENDNDIINIDEN